MVPVPKNTEASDSHSHSVGLPQKFHVQLLLFTAKYAANTHLFLRMAKLFLLDEILCVSLQRESVSIWVPTHLIQVIELHEQ